MGGGDLVSGTGGGSEGPGSVKVVGGLTGGGR